MTLTEKKVIVDYLRKGDEVSEILFADLANYEYPQEIHDLLSGLFEAIMQVDAIDKYETDNGTKQFLKEIEDNYALEELRNFDLLSDQLRMMSDETESIKNRIFEIGINAILNEAYKNYVSKAEG